MTGKSAITDGAGNFSVEKITVAEPKEKEVLVQIKASGVCHTDFDSQFWGDQLVMGHEGAGIVIAIGKDDCTKNHFLTFHIWLNILNIVGSIRLHGNHLK